MAREIPERDWEERKSGGAGAARQPLTNGEYREQIRKLERMAAVGSDE